MSGVMLKIYMTFDGRWGPFPIENGHLGVVFPFSTPRPAGFCLWRKVPADSPPKAIDKVVKGGKLPP